MLGYQLPERPTAPPEPTLEQEEANRLLYRYDDLSAQIEALQEELEELGLELQGMGFFLEGRRRFGYGP